MPMAVTSWPKVPSRHWIASKLNSLAKRALALTMRGNEWASLDHP
jgi:hypothetical protein